MAEDNIGFDANGGIGETQFAVIAPLLGSSVAVVETEAAAKVTVGSTSMTVDVAAGPTTAAGERHNITTVVNKTIAPVTLANAVRYDALVRRRNWSTNSVTTEVVPGTAAVGAQEVAPTLNDNPGVLHDQILALVKAVYGSTQLAVSDKRVWASKLLTVATKGSLPTPAPNLYGAVAYVIADAAIYRCLLVVTTLTWVADAPPIAELTGTAVMSPATTAGWAVDGTHVNRCLVLPYSRQVDLEVRRSGAELNADNADGNFADTTVATLTPTCSPDRPMPVPLTYITTDGKEFAGIGRIDPTASGATITLLGGSPARNVAKSTAIGFVSLRATLNFGRRTA